MHAYLIVLPTFLCHHCTTTTWKCLISHLIEVVNKRLNKRRLRFFLYKGLFTWRWGTPERRTWRLPGLADRATRLGGSPHLSGKRDQIKKLEIIWTSGLPHLPGVPHLHVNRLYVRLVKRLVIIANQFERMRIRFFNLKSDISTTVAVMVWKPWDIEAWREKITSGHCTRRLRGPCQKPRRNFHIKVTGMLVRKFKSNRLLPLRKIYVGSVNGQIRWLSIPNTLSETKIRNLHPKARRRESRHLNMGAPPPGGGGEQKSIIMMRDWIVLPYVSGIRCQCWKPSSSCHRLNRGVQRLSCQRKRLWTICISCRRLAKFCKEMYEKSAQSARVARVGGWPYYLRQLFSICDHADL